MSIKKLAIATATFAVVMTSATAHAVGASGAHLDELSAADRTTFAELQDRVRRVGDADEMAILKNDIDRFSQTHPDFVPIMVETQVLEWIRTSRSMGLINGSQSFLPWFLEFQKMAPDYPDPYILAARAYIYTSDFGGAMPSLNRARELAPDDPSVDLAWALLHDRKIERDAAEREARSAVRKSIGDDISMATAISVIAKHHGLQSFDKVRELAQTVCSVQCDARFLTAVVDRVMDGFNNEPGLLEAAAALANLAVRQGTPGPELQLQWARIALATGNVHMRKGAVAFDPAFMRPAQEVLDKIKDDPSVSKEVWGYRFDIAISNDDLAKAEDLLLEGEVRGLSAQSLGKKRAILAYRRGNLVEVDQMYRDLGLPDDRLVTEARARGGDADYARMFFQRQVEDNPTDGYLLGNYAGFLLWYLSDVEGAIYFGTRGLELTPYPLLQQTVAAAYLSLSGQQLRRGHLSAAAETYSEAAEIGYDEDFVVQLCWETCNEIRAAITAFR